MSDEAAAKLLDAEIKRKAKEIIRKARNSITDLGELEHLKIVETEAGEINFHFTQSSEFGKIDIYYSPQPYIEGLLTAFDRQIEKRINSEDWQGVPPEFADDLSQEAILEIARALFYHLPYECVAFMYDIPKLAAHTYEFLKPEKMLRRTEKEREEEVGEIIKDMNKRRHTVLLGIEKQYFAAVSAPQFIFCDIYDMDLAAWRKARAFYKKNKKFPNVLDITKTAFQQLDEDLIDKFALRGEGEPAALAFESTSRFLNVPLEKGASESSRKRYLAESRKQREAITQSEAEKAYKKYMRAWESYYETQHRRRQIIDDFTAKTSH